MSNSPLEPQKTDQSRLIEEIERQRLNRPQTENILELIEFHAQAMQLTPPLYTARAQQQTNQRATEGAKKEPTGVGKQRLLSPLVSQEVDECKGLANFLLSCTVSPKDAKALEEDLHFLTNLQEKQQYGPKELTKLTEMIQKFNMMGDKLSPAERKQYWAQVALMYDVISKMTKKMGATASNKDDKKLYKSLGAAAQSDSGAASAKADGNESLAQMFIDEILGRYMPQEEAELTMIALMLEFQNFGASSMNDLLNLIQNFGTALNDFNLSSMLGTPTTAGGNTYPNGQSIYDQWKKEEDSVTRDTSELNSLNSKINDQLQDIDQKLNANPPPSPDVKAGLEQMKSQLQGEQSSISGALQNLSTLGAKLSSMNVTVNADGTATVTGLGGTPSLSQLEGNVVNGDPTTGAGGLVSIYNDIKGFQQDYSNQSQSQQMSLQLTMTEMQQAWTVVSTCLTTLNQAMQSLAQSIYK